jgi:hypothetical protein
MEPEGAVRPAALVAELSKTLAQIERVHPHPDRARPTTGAAWRLYWPQGAPEPNVVPRPDDRYRLVLVAVIEDLVAVAFTWTETGEQSIAFLALMTIDPTSPAVAYGILEELLGLFRLPSWPEVDAPLVGRWPVIMLN